jgi:two-component system sensor histidine kinase VicK
LIDPAAFFIHHVETSSHIYFAYDVAARRVVFINKAYEHVLHGTCASVNEELPTLLTRLHPDDRAFLAVYWRLWTRGQMPDDIEIRVHDQTQPDYWQWLCLSPTYQLTADGRVLIGGEVRDISVAKHYAENADLFNSRKNAALEILSHDLSGAFVLAQQITQYLHEELTYPADSRVPELLRVLQTSSQAGVSMIREFVAIEFLTSAKAPLKANRIEISAALGPPLDQLQRQQALLGHYFLYTLPAEPVYANLDVNKFTQVLNNLVSNAIKFTPDGGQITVHVEPTPDCIRIHVTDTGIGIPAELQPHLFERFTPARRPGLRGEETTGMGLVLCKMIVEWHQGTLSFVSAEGQGTTFTIEIPQASISLRSAEAPDKPQESASSLA